MSQKQSYFRVVHLKVSNIKRIRAVEILPSSDVITIGGANDQGKTSLLDSILYLCAGNAAVCDQPIRHGATKAEIQAELKEYPGTDEKQVLIGDLIVKKVFTASGAPTLRVTTKDGVSVGSPQTILDQLCAKVTFDPLQFSRMDGPKQVEMLRKLVGLDFSDINRKRQQIYDERTLTNRDLSQKRAKLNSLPVHADAPKEEVSVSLLMIELKSIRDKNASNDQIRNRTALYNQATLDRNREVEVTRREIVALDARIKELQDERDAKFLVLANQNQAHRQAEADANAHQIVVMALKDISELDITDRITKADTENAKFRDTESRNKVASEVATLESTERHQTSQIEALDAEKQDLLGKAKFPLDGLSFDDSGVLLHGVPFNQAGTASKIRASMAIGMALNPRLRVALVRDGLLIDKQGMAEVEAFAKDNDCQVWIERGDTGEPVSLVLEDGQIAEK